MVVIICVLKVGKEMAIIGQRIKGFISGEPLLFVLILILVVEILFFPSYIPVLPFLVEWNTIFTILGLMVVTELVKESGFITYISSKIISNCSGERSLAIVIVTLSALLSAVFTNDVSLFMIVPLILELRDYLEDYVKLIVFVAIAVNVGSLLTPIGNPQNIFIWHKWGLSFGDFVVAMFPLFLVLYFLLLFFVFFSFPKDYMIEEPISTIEYNKRDFMFSLFLLIVFVVLAELDIPIIGAFFVVSIVAVVKRNILNNVDWFLVIFFVLLFMVIGVFSNLTFVREFFLSLSLSNPASVFIVSVIVSQVISNVPAVTLLANYINDWVPIAYGVNVGGNGVFLASLANIIAIRLSRDRRAWKIFHFYSILFLLSSVIIIYMIFYCGGCY